MTRPDDSIHPEVSYHEANLLHAWQSGEYSYDCQWQKEYSPAGRNHIPYIYSVAPSCVWLHACHLWEVRQSPAGDTHSSQ